MFNRHIQAGEHRQHIRPPGAAAAPFGVQRVADFAGELPPVEETQPLNEVDMGLEGPVDDYSYSTASRTAVSLDAFEQEGYDAWHRDEPAAPAANKMVMDALEGVPVGDSSTIEIMKAFSRGFERGRQEMMDREFPEMKGASRSAGWVLDDLAEAAGLSQSLGNGWSVLQTNGGGPVLFREFNDYDSGKVSPPDSSGVWNWSVHARLYQVNVGSGAANTAEEAMSMVEQTYAEYKRTASRKTASWDQEYDGTWFGSFPNDVLGWLIPSGDSEFPDTYTVSAEIDRPGDSRVLFTEFNVSLEEGKRMVEEAAAQVTSSRTAAGECPKCDGMGRETYETDTGSLSTQTCTACGGTGQAKEANRRTSAVTWHDQSDQFGGMWSTYQGSAPDSPNGQISESHGIYRWYVSDSGTRGNQQTGEARSLEEAKQEAERALASLGVTASRTASHRTAFLDTVELTEPRHRVAGWNWDDHLNGFIAAEAAREFTCACGDNVPAPGYTDCRCGKRWNAYTIQANGSQKMIAREVPVRENVVMARHASRKQADADTDARWFFQNLKGKGYTLPKDAGYPGDGGQFDEYLDDFARRDGLDAEALRSFLSDNWDEYSVGHPKDVARERALGASRKIGSEADSVGVRQRSPSRKTASPATMSDADLDLEYQKIRRQIDKGDGTNFDRGLELRRELKSRGLPTNLKPPHIMRQEYGDKYDTFVSRKQAAPSSGADAIAQHFPGWRVDDDNGNFWEIHSPGGEHAFIHEENGTYTLLMDDNTPDEFYATGLSFEDALAEVRAEGII